MKLITGLMSNASLRLQLLLIPIIASFILLPMILPVAGLPPPTGYMVNDWAYLLFSSEEEDLEDLCRYIEYETTVEIFVVTTTDLEGYDIARYSHLLFLQWGVGKADVDNGILLVLYYEDVNETHFSYEFDIELGLGMEGTITDSEAGQIGRNNFTIYFDYYEFYDGFYEGIVALYNEFKDDPRVIAGPQPFWIQTWAFEHPLIAGLIAGIPLLLIFQTFRFLIYCRNPIALLIAIAISIGLLIFAWWLDPIPPFLVLLYTLGISLGGGIVVSGVGRIKGGGGTSAGGGWRT
ncbi:MAG: TPM domain-containing protein [Promethearchaeota archaeon]